MNLFKADIVVDRIAAMNRLNQYQKEGKVLDDFINQKAPQIKEEIERNMEITLVQYQKQLQCINRKMRY